MVSPYFADSSVPYATDDHLCYIQGIASTPPQRNKYRHTAYTLVESHANSADCHETREQSYSGQECRPPSFHLSPL